MSEDEQQSDNEPEPEPDESEPESDENIINDLRRALAAERKGRKQITDELDRIKREGLGEQERAIEEARMQARAEVRAEYNARTLRAEVRAAAADKAIDPAAVVALLDLERFELDDEGRADSGAINSAIAELLKEKPYLAKVAESKRMPQGTRGTTGSPAAANGGDGEAWLRSIRR